MTGLRFLRQYLTLVLLLLVALAVLLLPFVPFVAIAWKARS